MKARDEAHKDAVRESIQRYQNATRPEGGREEDQVDAPFENSGPYYEVPLQFAMQAQPEESPLATKRDFDELMRALKELSITTVHSFKEIAAQFVRVTADVTALRAELSALSFKPYDGDTAGVRATHEPGPPPPPKFCTSCLKFGHDTSGCPSL